VKKGGGLGSCVGHGSEGNHRAELGGDGWVILGWSSRRWDVGI